MIVADGATPAASAQNLTKRAPFGNALNLQPIFFFRGHKGEAMASGELQNPNIDAVEKRVDRA